MADWGQYRPLSRQLTAPGSLLLSRVTDEDSDSGKPSATKPAVGLARKSKYADEDASDSDTKVRVCVKVTRAVAAAA